jgi:ketosteroid isomerase-like protein
MAHPNFELAEAVWKGIGAGDYDVAWDVMLPDVKIENGPGAPAKYRSLGGRDELAELLLTFHEVFGGTFKQEGTPVYADDRCSVVLVHETGTHAVSGDVFENTAVYISRGTADGKVQRLWTVDLDSEDAEAFWERNPLGD